MGVPKSRSPMPEKLRVGVGFMGRGSQLPPYTNEGILEHCKPPAGSGRSRAAKRFLTFYRRQMDFPGVSKASGLAMSHCIIFYSAIFFPNISGV